MVNKRPHVDGRRERSRSSRQRIVEALMHLISSGEMAPSAARVAEVAHVGLRTVFRHFDDMDAIYTEITDRLSKQVLPAAMEPFQASDWRAIVLEMADRRAHAFEILLPFRLSGETRRFSSPLLLEQYQQVIHLERDLVLRRLPQKILDHPQTRESICACLSFHNWRGLRHDQQLPADEARKIVIHMANSLMDSLCQIA